jgi:hypothetical protein
MTFLNRRIKKFEEVENHEILVDEDGAGCVQLG